MIFKPTYHAVIPADAKLFTKGGKQYARFRLQRSGELVTGEVVKDGKARIASPTYYARIRKNGKTIRIPLGVKDKESAMQLRAQLQLKADHQRSGTIDPFAQHRAKSMLDHLAEYKTHLESKGRCEKHISETVRTITSVLKACQFHAPEHLNQADLDAHLANLIKKGKSFRTRNIAMKATRALASFMVRSGRLAADPFQMCESLNCDTDPKRRLRRALSPADFARVVAAAEVGEVVQGVSGPQRALIYMTSIVTGLRRSELAHLQVGNLHLDYETPFITLPAAIDKTRRGTTIPLHPVLVDKLREWVRLRRGHVFDLLTDKGRPRYTNRMMQHDCEAAGIPYTTDLGTADLHSLRAAFITALCRSGADFSMVVKLARHSTPRLTALVYDKVQLSEKSAVINQLVLPKS